jgi:hypothetical protein
MSSSVPGGKRSRPQRRPDPFLIKSFNKDNILIILNRALYMGLMKGPQLPAGFFPGFSDHFPALPQDGSAAMIVSASYKTDIPAFFGEWFRRRLAAGSCDVVNPYGGTPFSVLLGPDAVDGFVFWTRNAGPFFDTLRGLHRSDRPFVVHFTITGYPTALDRATIPAAAAVRQVRDLAAAFGPRALVWRYDPIVFSTITPPAHHRAAFARLAAALEGAVDEAVVSFAHMYAKTRRNLEAAARAYGFSWRDPEAAEKQALLGDLAAIAADHGMRLTVCGQPDLRVAGTVEARCIDAERLSDVAGAAVRALQKAHRTACGCWASKDIGAYDTCVHGCVYCYAVNTRGQAKDRRRRHDPAGSFLVDPGK